MSEALAIPQTQAGLSDGQIQIQIQQAKSHQADADLVTDLRRLSGIPLALAHVIFGENWVIFAGGVISAGSDGVDGYKSRKGQAITTKLGLPRIPSRTDDPEADRALFDALIIGQVARDAIIEQDYLSAAVKSAAFIANKTRDVFMARARAEALAQGKNIDAIKINKFKTNLLLAGAVLGLSPEAKTNRGKITHNTAIVGGVALGVYGYFKFRQHLDNQPTKLRAVPVDTIPELF